jgi:hypothetical protein
LVGVLVDVDDVVVGLPLVGRPPIGTVVVPAIPVEAPTVAGVYVGYDAYVDRTAPDGTDDGAAA